MKYFVIFPLIVISLVGTAYAITGGTSDNQDSSLQKILEDCKKTIGIAEDGYSLWNNQTHKITTGSCEIKKRTNSGISLDPTPYPMLWNITSPLKQLELGISFDEIQCKQNLVLIQKYDGTPACVTESTKTKLIERGWTGEKSWTASYDESNIPSVIIPLGSASPTTQKNFEPQTIKVILGINNTIQWINQDDVPSSVTSDHDYDGYGFVSPHLKPGDSWTHTFTKAGVYDYHSIPHPWKNGKVIVEEETENIVNGITWGSNITKNYGINDNIEFQVTVTMNDPPCNREMIAKIYNIDYSETFWQESVKPECANKTTMKANFPEVNPIHLEEGTYYLQVDTLGGGYGMLSERFTITP